MIDRVWADSTTGTPLRAPTIWTTCALPSPLHRVLDFGCGLGRNIPYLRSIAEDIVGFDLPPMIERGRALGLPALLTSDWEVSARAVTI
ncbi:MAG TPA: hypothetical protein VFJ02_00170 [Vicinamibacterales bacterium]|nr:hypothetical protein [Vicinamibacterales bacterium]